VLKEPLVQQDHKEPKVLKVELLVLKVIQDSKELRVLKVQLRELKELEDQQVS
jgi:hypothetical protein